MKITWSKNDRTRLAAELQKYWLGKENSQFAMQYLELKDGIVKAIRGNYERKDIFLGQIDGICNIFVDVNNDGSYYVAIDWYESSGIVGDAGTVKRIEEEAIKFCKLRENSYYIAANRRFLKEQPWLKCQDKTVQECINILSPYVFVE